jgi:uroporphyrinogen-III decarboxylase
MDKTAAELYREREQRVTDAIQLKKPDRIPVMLELSYFPAKYAGISCEAAYYDYDAWMKAYCRTVQDLAPDVVQIASFFPGKFYEILESRQIKLPGKGVDPCHAQQFVEGEFLKADEYDVLMEDRTDFLLRRYLPRIFGALEPLAKLPPVYQTAFSYQETTNFAESLASPDIQQALEKLLEAGREISRWRPRMKAFGAEIEMLGFPLYGTSGEHIPFDHLSYHVRGMRGIFLDMYRQPEKLLEVMDYMMPRQVEKALAKARAGGRKRVYFALHRGADGFMSAKQFEVFYWPYVKIMVLSLIDAGFTPCLFLEGDYTSRLEYFRELPEGKILARFDSADINRVKKVLQGHLCIMGNVPVSLMQTGAPGDVEDYCKKLIDLLGEGGGFIMAPRSAPDDVRPENLKAMVETTMKYGVYG